MGKSYYCTCAVTGADVVKTAVNNETFSDMGPQRNREHLRSGETHMNEAEPSTSAIDRGRNDRRARAKLLKHWLTLRYPSTDFAPQRASEGTHISIVRTTGYPTGDEHMTGGRPFEKRGVSPAKSCNVQNFGYYRKGTIASAWI